MSERRWWMEWQLWLAVLLTVAIYLPRIGQTRLTAEETRRAQVAREMMWTGDWIVPREQNEPFLSRPPVQNWLIAASVWVAGGFSDATVRVHSVIAMAALALLVYGYSRRFLTPLGAAGAAIAFPTMGHVFQYGWLGETEPVYTLFVSGSLLLWRWADLNKRTLLAWCVGYALAGLGMLSKGAQAPVYFAAGVGVFLVLERRWRELFRWQHFVGLGVFFAVWLAWQIPYCLRVTPHEAWVMFHGDTSMRFHDSSAGKFFKHLAVFPLEVFGCMLPWSVLLIAYARREFRASLGAMATEVKFLTCGAGFAFITCWVVPEARNRYFAPLYPCVAPLLGLVIQRASEAATGTAVALLWKRYVVGLSVVMAVGAASILGVTVADLGPEYGGQTLLFGLFYAAVTFALAGFALWSLRPTNVRPLVGVLTIAAFLGLTYMGVVFNTFVATRVYMDDEVAALKQQMGPDAQLVSLGLVTHTFIYYYGEPVRLLPPPSVDSTANADWTYFCVDHERMLADCKFPYEVIARIKADSNASPVNPKTIVTIARRLPGDAVASRPESSVRQ